MMCLCVALGWLVYCICVVGCDRFGVFCLVVLFCYLLLWMFGLVGCFKLFVEIQLFSCWCWFAFILLLWLYVVCLELCFRLHMLCCLMLGWLGDLLFSVYCGLTVLLWIVCLNCILIVLLFDSFVLAYFCLFVFKYCFCYIRLSLWVCGCWLLAGCYFGLLVVCFGSVATCLLLLCLWLTMVCLSFVVGLFAFCSGLLLIALFVWLI